MNWICLVSGTGKEVMNLSTAIQKLPSIIITNNIDNINLSAMIWMEFNNIPIISFPSKPSPQDYEKYFSMLKSPIITLHGYMRILPINKLLGDYKIFNGHPGLITKYPFLKGKDPQQRAFDLRLTEIGSVVHRVVQEVDSGEILCGVSQSIYSHDRQHYFDVLRKTSLDSWIYFFDNKLYI